MTTPQPTLFDTNEPVSSSSCGATNLTNYTRGCRCHQCTTLKRQAKDRWRRGVRKCRNCSTEYVKQETEGALNVYCSIECRNAYYGRNAARVCEEQTCGGCGQPHQAKYLSSREYRWNLCPTCLGSIEPNQTSFANHSVPADIIHQFVKDPTCAICGTNIAGRIPHGAGKFRPAAVVDHDHTCCPRAQSCGQCVRGILCR